MKTCIAAAMMALSFSLLAPMANASNAAWIYIDDMSKLEYQLTNDGRLYFRNLNEFNPDVTGCCYAFYLDTATNYGKSAWALILMKMASGGGLTLRVYNDSPPPSGAPERVDYMGEW